MGKKAECCESYKKKGKPCGDCPEMARLGKKKRRKLLKRYRKKGRD